MKAGRGEEEKGWRTEGDKVGGRRLLSVISIGHISRSTEVQKHVFRQ